jgi:hypothetical protein
LTFESGAKNGSGTTPCPDGNSRCTVARGWPFSCGPGFWLGLARTPSIGLVVVVKEACPRKQHAGILVRRCFDEVLVEELVVLEADILIRIVVRLQGRVGE